MLGNTHDSFILKYTEDQRQRIFKGCVAVSLIGTLAIARKSRFRQITRNVAIVYAAASLGLRLEHNLNPF